MSKASRVEKEKKENNSVSMNLGEGEGGEGGGEGYRSNIIPFIPNASLALTGHARFSGVDFTGTLFINNDDDDDFVGIVFSYQSSSAFYVITWKKKRQTYWKKTPFPAVAEPGLQLKVG